MDTKKYLGERIHEIRRKRGLKQSELAEKLNIDPKYISKIECGRCFPSFELLDKLAVALNRPVVDFLNVDHLLSRSDLEEKIKIKIKSLSEEQLRSIYIILNEIF